MNSLACTRRGGQSSFELTPENEEIMLKAFAGNAEKLARLKHRISQYKSEQLRIQSLQRQRDAMLARNEKLVEASVKEQKQEEEAVEEEMAATAAAATAAAVAAVVSPPRRSVQGIIQRRNTTDDLEEGTADAKTAPVPDSWGTALSPYHYRGPSVKGIVTSVFSDGMLFRIISDSGEWSFYNDTRYYEMQVHYILDPKSSVKAGPKSSVKKLSNGSWEAKLTLFPEETALLFSGTVAGFDNKSKANLLPRTFESPADLNEMYRVPTEALATLVKSCGKSVEVVPNPDTAVRCADLSTSSALATALEKELPFVDPQFSPSHAALFRQRVDGLFIPPLHWRPPAEFIPADAASQLRLFRGTVSASGVAQGSLFPNYNFLSAAAALVEFPRMLRMLFSHPVDAEQGKRERRLGAYRAMFCFSGWWTDVVVDHYIPSTANHPEFSRYQPDLRQLWLPVLEKAYAKSFLSYASILETPLECALLDLTGAPLVPLEQVWPSAAGGTATAATATTGSSNASAARPTSNSSRKENSVRRSSMSVSAPADPFVHAVRQHFENKRGVMILKTFPLSTAKSKDKRDRLEEAYKDLGLAAGYSVAAVDMDVVNNGEHLLLRVRQSPRSAGGNNEKQQEWVRVWKEMGKPWAEEAWELSYGLNDTQSLWMDVKDVAQYFKEGFFLYGVENSRSTRVKGLFLNGIPTTCLQLRASAKCTVTLTLTKDDRRFDPATRARRSITELLRDNAGSVTPMALLVCTGSGAQTSLVQCSSAPNIFDVTTDVKYSYAQQVSCAITLLPGKKDPYYVIPRLRSGTDVEELGYVITAFVSNTADVATAVEVRGVEVADSAPVFTAAWTPKASLFNAETDVSEVQSDIQILDVK